MERAHELFEKLKARILEYNPQCDFEVIDKAYNLAMEAHSGQQRISGEPYIVHPLSVALILTEIDMDSESIAAAILHDTVEDTQYTCEDIENLFGEHIALLVEGVTKLSKIPYSTKEEQQTENLRKMFFAMAKDIRVILIKLADRLHNMRTLKSMSREKQLEKSRETMEVYAPLAHRLGMAKIKWELEDLSLRYLDPIAYKEISTKIAEKRQEREEYLEMIEQILTTKLAELSINVKVEGRVKHFYSIYNKMYKNNIDIDEIYDLLAVRVLVDTVNDCYAVLGLVHEIFKPIPGRFKDYIAMPKKNNYQSLHTSLIGPTGRPFEVQIRTWEMHRQAEVGIAAHWKYKEGITGATDMDSKLEWVRQLLEVHKDSTDADEFMRSLKVDLFEEEVFVFSPKGDVINLPAGSCPIDFAYAIHSAIGNKTTGAKINGKIVPLDHKLQNGDIVEIITSSVPHGPSKDWLKIIKTSQARKKINEWFKKENREENILRGRDMVEKELKKSNIPLSYLNREDWARSIWRRYSFHSMDDLYAALGYGVLPLSKVMNRIREEYQLEKPAVPVDAENGAVASRPVKSNDGVVVNGLDNCLVRFSRCCNPVPGDDIAGYITRGRGVSIHRSDCINVRNLKKSDAQSDGRFVSVWWADGHRSSYMAMIKVVAIDRQGLTMDVINILSELKINLHAVNARETKDGLAIVDVTIEINNKSQLDAAMKKIWKIEGVTSVVRTKQ